MNLIWTQEKMLQSTEGLSTDKQQTTWIILWAKWSQPTKILNSIEMMSKLITTLPSLNTANRLPKLQTQKNMFPSRTILVILRMILKSHRLMAYSERKIFLLLRTKLRMIKFSNCTKRFQTSKKGINKSTADWLKTLHVKILRFWKFWWNT